MTSLIAQRVCRLADTLAELKLKIRAALATELAAAVGTAIRDVLLAALLDRLASASRPSRSSVWRDDECDRQRVRCEDPNDPWADDDSDRDHAPTRYDLDEPAEGPEAVPAATAVAAGVNVGRWWFAKKGSLIAAVGVGLLTTTLGFVGGPVARAALSVLTAATDVLTAESVLARADPP